MTTRSSLGAKTIFAIGFGIAAAALASHAIAAKRHGATPSGSAAASGSVTATASGSSPSAASSSGASATAPNASSGGSKPVAAANVAHPELEHIESAAEPVKLKFKQATLKKLFDVLQKVTPIQYELADDLSTSPKVTMELQDVPLKTALAQIADSYGIHYKVVAPNKLIVTTK